MLPEESGGRVSSQIRSASVLAIDITLPLAAARPAHRGRMALASAAVVAISRLAGAAPYIGAQPSA